MQIEFQMGTFVVMMFNFILLMAVLVRLLYRPIQGILEQRRQKITQDLDEARQSKEMAERLRKEAQIALEEAHVEAYEIVEKAKNEAERLREDLTMQTRQELDQLRKRSQLELERSKTNARRHLQEETVSLALLVVQKLISKNMTAEFNESLVRNLLEEIEKGDDRHDFLNGV